MLVLRTDVHARWTRRLELCYWTLTTTSRAELAEQAGLAARLPAVHLRHTSGDISPCRRLLGSRRRVGRHVLRKSGVTLIAGLPKQLFELLGCRPAVTPVI